MLQSIKSNIQKFAADERGDGGLNYVVVVAVVVAAVAAAAIALKDPINNLFSRGANALNSAK